MADPVLHIKDSYYFEIPKLLYLYDYRTAAQFPAVWISLDPKFQNWEADRLLDKLKTIDAELPPSSAVVEEWHHWVHADHANFAKPLDVFLEEKYQGHFAKFGDWKAAELKAANEKKDASIEKVKRYDFSDYISHLKTTGSPDEAYLNFLTWRHKSEAAFHRAKSEAGGKETIEQVWKKDVREGQIPDWDQATIKQYNEQLSGKILIPQPFGTLRNFYEPQTTIFNDVSRWGQAGIINRKDFGFCISKYMLLELVVGLILVFLFSRLAQQIAGGKPPKGKLWNLLEVFLVFIRDQIAKPSLGGHHEEDSLHPEHGHELGGPYAEHGRADHGKTVVELEHAEHHPHMASTDEPHRAAQGHHAHHDHGDPADRFVPLLWTIFFFVLGCNLMGMVPWAGAPTAAFSVTLALAGITFATVIVAGMLQFGFVGFFLNQVPGMDLPWPMAIVIKPMIFLIEMLGLCIKHGVLAVRLLANMVAGHLVILGIMGLAFGAEAAVKFSGAPGWQWGVTAIIAVVASVAFNVLELFVAFLQAYIITFLSALFIGAAIHKH